MAISVLQVGWGSDTSSTTTEADFDVGITAGSVILVLCVFDNQVSFVSLSDGHAPSGPTDAVTDSGLGIVDNSALFMGTYIKAFLKPTAGSSIITMTTTTGLTFSGMTILEVAGFTNPTFDKKTSNPVTSHSATWTGIATGALTSANEIAAGVIGTDGSGITGLTTAWSHPTKGTNLVNGIDINGFGFEYLITPHASSLTETGTAAANTAGYTALTATLMEFGSGAIPPLVFDQLGAHITRKISAIAY